MKDHDFRKLLVWQRALQFCAEIYRYSSFFPRSEQFGLCDQIRRAVVSIALNISEGAGSGSNKEFIRFLHMAKRSAYEVMTAIEIANKLGYASTQDTKKLLKELSEISAMIVGLIQKMKEL